jgi:predicted dithiol-disulfide oxidoreductase (DUF899 family)
VTSQVRELSYIHSRDVTYAVLCQGPYNESARYREFMGWDIPWYSAQSSLDVLLTGRRVGRMHLVCYLRQGERVFETYWTTGRGVEVMDNSYRLLDFTAYGRQEMWEDSPAGWPQRFEGKQISGPTDAPPPSGPGSTLDARMTWVPTHARSGAMAASGEGLSREVNRPMWVSSLGLSVGFSKDRETF